MTRTEAQRYRAAIETAVQSLDDETAAEVPTLFPTWTEGTVYKTGKKVNYNGTLYTVLQDHTSQSDWTPDTASSLFTEVLTSEDGTPQEWVQPDSTNGYAKGDRVIYNGVVYESVYDGLNVWSPEAYPDGWKKITESEE